MSERKYKISFDFLKSAVWMTVILAVLKLAGIIDINVWWVLSPILILFGIVILFMTITFMVLINVIFEALQDNVIEDDEEDDSE